MQHQSRLVQQLKQNHRLLFFVHQVRVMHTHQLNHQIPASVAHLCHWGIILVIASPVLTLLDPQKVLNDPRNQVVPPILGHPFNTLRKLRYIIHRVHPPPTIVSCLICDINIVHSADHPHAQRHFSRM